MALPITKELGDLGDTLNRYFWILVFGAIIVGVFVIGLLVYLFR